MKQYLIHLYERLHSSFWSVPLIMILAALALCAFTVHLDTELPAPPLLFRGSLQWFDLGNIENARALLSVIAGSTITVAGTVFSITMVALSLASNQFGPHLIRNFIRDRATQISLGIFLATYVYAIVTMRSIGTAENEIANYGISVLTALVLTLISVIYLIYFIHNVAQSIQVDNITHRINLEFQQAIEREYPDCHESTNKKVFDTKRLDLGSSWIDIPTPKGGYVQFIDKQRITRTTQNFQCCLKLNCHPGSYLHHWEMIGQVYPANNPERIIPAIQSAIQIGTQPTAEQDVVFSIQQLSQIAVRALSPGINDPFTAYSCVDRLIEGLGTVLYRPEPANCFTDSSGELRIICSKLDFSQLLQASLDEIVEHGRSSSVFMCHLLNALETLVEVCHRKTDKQALKDYLKRLNDDNSVFIKSKVDQQIINDKLVFIREKLKS
ncbi:DUF2254 domain-containing protein [Microbulbifer sp. TRSA007]|uniref:DUF2254 domain-containing protein n=1 Tax=Microbulbifer sp. TRSA007 TaxID=3243384 RepID=UPI00403A739D